MMHDLFNPNAMVIYKSKTSFMCLFESRPVLIRLPRTGRAVRCVLERGEDMLITGARHPVLGKHKVLPLLKGFVM